MDTFLDSDLIIPEEISHAVVIHCSRSRVYQTLTTAEGWNAWFTVDSSFDARVGGRIIWQWKDWGADRLSTGDHGQILELEQDRRLVFSWHPDRLDYTTRVEIVLEDIADGCVLRVRETGFEDSPSGLHAIIQCATGWGEALTLLKVYLEHGISCKKIT